MLPTGHIDPKLVRLSGRGVHRRVWNPSLSVDASATRDSHHSPEPTPMDWLNDPNAWIGLLTLTALEIVLGIDNIIFISILSSKLRPDEQPKARRLGLLGARGRDDDAAAWAIARRRGIGPAHPEGLHLLRDGILGSGGGADIRLRRKSPLRA